MTQLTIAANIVLGMAYSGYGVMTAVEMKRDWRTFGFSHFGLAWIFMAFTCGPHHLEHALHLIADGTAGHPLDAVAVVFGLPFGVVWLLLRIEAFIGGPGDRFIAGHSPGWRTAMASAFMAYGLAIVALSTQLAWAGFTLNWTVVASVALVAVYMAIGAFAARTQLANHRHMGGWSLSGVCLTVIFPTCAVMHAAFGALTATGSYSEDVHTRMIDLLSIPAGLYFLWVVRSLYHDSLRDWNDGPRSVEAEALA